MKKKIVTVALTAAMAVSTLTGCSLTKESSSTEPVSTVAENNESATKDSETAEATESVENEEPSAETTSTEVPEENSSTTETENNVEIASDVFSWQLAMDGKTYTFPCDASAFEKNGWKIEEGTLRGALEGDVLTTSYQTYADMEKGEDKVTVYLQNSSKEEQDYSNCTVGGVKITLYNIKSDLSMVLPGDLVVSKNLTQEEVIEKYGEPTEKRESDYNISLEYTYDGDNDKCFKAVFSKDDGKLSSIEYKNF